LEHSLDKLHQVFINMINAVAAASEKRDPFTAGHQSRVAELATAIGKKLGLKGDRYDALNMAARIHDIGKINIPIEILSNPRKLTRLEYEMIKTHSKVGYDILQNLKSPWNLAEIVYQHHERMDGSGYPRGLTGDHVFL